MKKAIIFKLVSLVIAIVMLASLITACGGGKSKTEDTSAAKSAENQAAESTLAPAADNSPVTFNLFINHTWYWIDKFEGLIPQEMTKRTGVTLNITRATDDKQLPVMLASGDLPEMIYTASQMDRLSDPNLSYSWNELIQKYAPDLKFTDTEIQNAKSYSKDDNYYTIMNAFATEEQWNSEKYALPSPGTSGMALRKDILEKLGNPQINTLDDIAKVFGMVKQQMPDMIPLVLNTGWKFKYFENQMGYVYGANNMFDNGNGLSYKIYHPKYLDYLKYVNQLYRNGYITADNFALKSEQESEQYMLSGKGFAYSYVSNAADDLNGKAASANPNISFTQITKELSPDASYLNTGIGWSGIFITKNNKNPERAIKFMQFLFSKDGQRLSLWGREGTDWDLSPDGYPIWKGEMKEAQKDGNVLNQKFNPRICFGMSAVTEGLSQVNPDMRMTMDAQLAAKSVTKYAPRITLASPLADTDEKTILTKLDELVNNEEIKIILSKTDGDFQKNYDNMIKTAEQIGVKKLEEALTQKYNSLK